MHPSIFDESKVKKIRSWKIDKQSKTRLFFLFFSVRGDRGDGMGENEGSFEDRGGKGRSV